MINQEEFVFRLKKVITHYNENAASFSEKIGVQRSSISHILSGRNKPSLEFIMKVLSSYDEVDLYWLLNGKGSFPAKSEKQNTPTLQVPDAIENVMTTQKLPTQKNVDKVMIFYTDGTFEVYNK